MKSIFYLLFALGVTVRFGVAADAPADIHTVDFRETDNLKAIFDAGIRPTHVLGLESAECEFSKEKLKFLLPGNLNFSVDAESCDISVLAENKIISIALYAPQMKLAEGIEYTRKVATELGMDTKDLDQKKIDDGSRDYVDKEPAWGGYLAKGNIEIQLRLEYVRTSYIAFTELYVGINWDQPGSIMKFLTGPIQPPPGYENVSMDPLPPSQWPPARPNNFLINQPPGSRVNRQNSSGTDSASAPTAPANATSANFPSNSQTKTSSGTSSSQNPLLTPANGWWVLLGLLVFLLGAYALKRNK